MEYLESIPGHLPTPRHNHHLLASKGCHRILLEMDKVKLIMKQLIFSFKGTIPLPPPIPPRCVGSRGFGVT